MGIKMCLAGIEHCLKPVAVRMLKITRAGYRIWTVPGIKRPSTYLFPYSKYFFFYSCNTV